MPVRLHQRGSRARATLPSEPLAPPLCPAHLHHMSPPRAPEGLDGEEFALFHARGVAPLNDGDVFPCVNLVRADAVAVQVADALDRVGGSVDLDFVALHYLLDGRADLQASPSRRERQKDRKSARQREGTLLAFEGRGFETSFTCGPRTKNVPE